MKTDQESTKGTVLRLLLKVFQQNLFQCFKGLRVPEELGHSNQHIPEKGHDLLGMLTKVIRVGRNRIDSLQIHSLLYPAGQG